jgi:hypothetical protein
MTHFAERQQPATSLYTVDLTNKLLTSAIQGCQHPVTAQKFQVEKSGFSVFRRLAKPISWHFLSSTKQIPMYFKLPAKTKSLGCQYCFFKAVQRTNAHTSLCHRGSPGKNILQQILLRHVLVVKIQGLFHSIAFGIQSEEVTGG